MLERKEYALARTFLGLHAEKILSIEKHLTIRDLVCRVSHYHVAERTLSCAIQPHQRMYLAVTHYEIDTLQYFLAID